MHVYMTPVITYNAVHVTPYMFIELYLATLATYVIEFVLFIVLVYKTVY